MFPFFGLNWRSILKSRAEGNFLYRKSRKNKHRSYSDVKQNGQQLISSLNILGSGVFLWGPPARFFHFYLPPVKCRIHHKDVSSSSPSQGPARLVWVMVISGITRMSKAEHSTASECTSSWIELFVWRHSVFKVKPSHLNFFSFKHKMVRPCDSIIWAAVN